MRVKLVLLYPPHSDPGEIKEGWTETFLNQFKLECQENCLPNLLYTFLLIWILRDVTRGILMCWDKITTNRNSFQIQGLKVLNVKFLISKRRMRGVRCGGSTNLMIQLKDQSIRLKLPITEISSSIVQASTQARLKEDNTQYKCQNFSVTDSWRQKKQLKVQDWRQSLCWPAKHIDLI